MKRKLTLKNIKKHPLSTLRGILYVIFMWIIASSIVGLSTNYPKLATLLDDNIEIIVSSLVALTFGFLSVNGMSEDKDDIENG